MTVPRLDLVDCLGRVRCRPNVPTMIRPQEFKTKRYRCRHSRVVGVIVDMTSSDARLCDPTVTSICAL